MQIKASFFNHPFVLLAVFAGNSRTDTFVSAPTVATSAAGEVVPNRATATATAGTKKPDSPIIPSGTAIFPHQRLSAPFPVIQPFH